MTAHQEVGLHLRCIVVDKEKQQLAAKIEVVAMPKPSGGPEQPKKTFREHCFYQFRDGKIAAACTAMAPTGNLRYMLSRQVASDATANPELGGDRLNPSTILRRQGARKKAA